MFSVIADLITLCATTLFPLFAAYKALKSPTPASVAPWLIFYATLSVVHFIENTVLYPLNWVPFYSWVRLFGHLYLLLPAPQGASHVYTSYIKPYLTQHENDIEQLISDTHDKLKSLGLQYFKQAADWVRVNILGQQPRPPTPPAPAYQSYAQTLLSRFYSPSTASYVAQPTPGAPASTEFYNSVLSALSSATSGMGGPRTTSRAVDLSSSGSLVPAELTTPVERLRYITQAREGLATLMQMYEREANDATEDHGSEGLSKSRSETEFDKIEREEVQAERAAKRETPVRSGSGGGAGWMNWIRGTGAAHEDAAARKKETEEIPDVPAQGASSGIDVHGH